MGSQKGAHRISVVFLSGFKGAPMGFPLDSFGVSMSFCGDSMGVPWYFYSVSIALL